MVTPLNMVSEWDMIVQESLSGKTPAPRYILSDGQKKAAIKAAFVYLNVTSVFNLLYVVVCY